MLQKYGKVHLLALAGLFNSVILLFFYDINHMICEVWEIDIVIAAILLI